MLYLEGHANRHLLFRLAASLIGAWTTATYADAAPLGTEPSPIVELHEIEVSASTPLTGLDQPLSKVPANVQSTDAAEIDRAHTLGVADFMNQHLNGVNITETQDNPYQPDVYFRGFTASPLLGTPEGISVFVDGVRVNESFGDVVNWDLIPASAIADVTLVPGSNSVFGLNTLGGALSVRTKNGRQFPGSSIQVYGGSFGRRAMTLQSGRALPKGFDYYINANYLDEDGWRDASPSHLRQAMGKVGWTDARTTLDLTYNWADNNLIGNGFTPESMLAQNRKASFAIPDQSINHLDSAIVQLRRLLSPAVTLSGNLYFRRLRTFTFNGDVNDDYSDAFEEAVDTGGACFSAPTPDTCAADLLADQTGLDHHSLTDQRRWGGGIQLAHIGSILGLANSLTAGISRDDGHSNFLQTSQSAQLNVDRTTTPTGAVELDSDLYGSNQTNGIYWTDTLSISQQVAITAAARYNKSTINLADRLGSSLNGRHTYNRINPAIGATLNPSAILTLYANYNEGSRTPTPIELGCADPNTPCKLPNAMASDPHLDQVVARTFELGARGSGWDENIRWSGALFRTASANDIQFIASSTSGAGYFANVGSTRRQGVELELHGALARIHWRASYSFVDATYRSTFDLVAPDNSSSDAAGFITVSPGNRIPLIPRHTGRLSATYLGSPRYSVAANLILSSGQYLMENNNNLSRVGIGRDGVIFHGSGRTGSYAVLNLDGEWRPLPSWTLFGRVNNVFDTKYSTSGSLGSNPFSSSGVYRSNPDDWTEENTVSPAAPRGIWVGVTVKFD